MSAIIRPARPEDASVIDQVALSAFAQYRDHYSDWATFSRGIGGMSGFSRFAELMVAERAGRVVGAVVYVGPGKPKPAFFAPEWPVIRMLVVDPEARGGGIGRLLTEACIARARADAAPLIALHTTPIQAVALAMYLRMGFRELRPIEPIFGLPYSVYTLRLAPGGDRVAAG